MGCWTVEALFSSEFWLKAVVAVTVAAALFGVEEVLLVVVLASLPTIDSMLKPIFCLGVGIITADVGTGGIILVINTRFFICAMRVTVIETI